MIIWGSRGRTSTVEEGQFFCPRCRSNQPYKLQRVQRWFTLYFIPIFPIGGAERYVECRGCGQAFKESVLEYEPPSELDRLLGQFYEELQTSTSLEVVKRKLTNEGMDGDEAEQILDKMCEGRARACQCGQRFHPRVRRCSACGEYL